MAHTGFFPASSLVSKAPASLLPKCGACGLKDVCRTPQMEVSGEGRRKILIVAEAPGEEEDKQGIQLVGKTGKYLERKLAKVGIKMRRDCWLTNAVICRPPENETPDSRKVEYCRPNLIRTIRDKKPHIIIVAGAVAIESIMPYIFRDSDYGGIARWAGYIIPSQKINAWVCPIYHPSYVVREDSAVLELIYEQHLEAIAKLKGRPWNPVPAYKDQVELVHNPRRAANIIRNMIRNKGLAAFDYETNCLKPDNPDARIISCSICLNGKRTIAYPWIDDAIHATADFLLSPVQKIGANIKFEERWTQAVFGHGVSEWVWDTQLAAHIIDCRDPKVTGVKFQSFVLLGEEGYDDAIKPWLRSTTGKINRINEVEMDQLLRYNALDSLFEYFVAHKQMEIINGKARSKIRA